MHLGWGTRAAADSEIAAAHGHRARIAAESLFNLAVDVRYDQVALSLRRRAYAAFGHERAKLGADLRLGVVDHGVERFRLDTRRLA